MHEHPHRRPGARRRNGCARPRTRSSMAGVVSGMTATVVNPPCAAAARPVATVSASSLPGSRKCAWRSTNPGAISTPSASSPSASEPASQRHRSSRPSRTTTSPATLPPRRRVDDPAAQRGASARRPPRRPRPDRPVHATGSGRVPASRYRSAIRTATPLVTWVGDHRPRVDATSAAISTPSFIGPGCMTTTSGDAARSRSAVSP